MKKGSILHAGSVRELIEEANHYTWICKAVSEEQVRELERDYYITSKQYEDGELQVKLVSETKPLVECIPTSTTLEDAYIYLMNKN